jgi:16S rRNA (cytosine967-C5)-methyltransferase
MTARKVALEIITDVLNGEAYSNLLLNKRIKDQAVSPVDVGLLTELVYGTIQYKLTLDYYLNDYIEGKKIPNYIRNNLNMAIYQMVYLDKIPNHAIINEAVELTKDRYGQSQANFVNAVLRNMIRNGFKRTDIIEDEFERLSIESSHPIWLVKMWSKQYDMETARKLCEVNNIKPYQFARLNLQKERREAILKRLEKENIIYHEVGGVEEAIYFTSNNIATTPIYHKGFLNVQDLSSMLVGKVVNPQPNERILDTCSAPGGKSTHMAELMKNQGEIYSCDIHEHKIELIQHNANRLGASIIKPVLCDATQLSSHFEKESFDRVLVDAPCSGFGVIRRKPEIKYNKKPEDLDVITGLQKAIIDEAVLMVKKGGRLVYSTCTINKKENEKMVEYILSTYPDFELDKEAFKVIGIESNGMVQLIDQFPGADVFFISCFKRN